MLDVQTIIMRRDQHTAKALAQVALIKSFPGGQYQTKEIQQHHRRYNPSVKFAKQGLFFLPVDVDMVLNGVVLLLVCRIWRVGSCLFYLEIHRDGSGLVKIEKRQRRPRMVTAE